MSEDKRIITINESDFSLSKSPFMTKKKRPSTKTTGGIKVKSETTPKKETTMKKRSIVNMMRKHQKERGELLDKKEEDNDNETAPFKTNFNSAKEYLEKLTKQEVVVNKPNRTIKQMRQSSSHIEPIFNNLEYENVSLQFPSSLPSSNIQIKGPLYGCLKNGTLPTYRKYMNQTQKVAPVIEKEKELSPPLLISEKVNEGLKEMSAIKQLETKLKQDMVAQKPKMLKQRRTLRRTYKVGRSKTLPQVSVLISNNSIRKQISTQTHTIKQTSMDEVKKNLIKQGLIKIGSTAPNDVLRKMYESTMLLCGDVQNHNPDNTLHNFIHGQS